MYLCVSVPYQWIAVKYMPYFKKAELSLYILTLAQIYFRIIFRPQMICFSSLKKD